MNVDIEGFKDSKIADRVVGCLVYEITSDGSVIK